MFKKKRAEDIVSIISYFYKSPKSPHPSHLAPATPSHPSSLSGNVWDGSFPLGLILITFWQQLDKFCHLSPRIP